jgi:hypothetical protein
MIGVAAWGLLALAAPAWAQADDSADTELDAMGSMEDELGGLDELDALDELDDLNISRTDDSAVRVGIFKGSIAEEFRSYMLDRDTDKSDEQVITELQGEVSLEVGPSVSVFVAPRFVIDALDPELYRYEPTEAYASARGEWWDLRVGQLVDNLGVVDAYNPLDVLNRRDYGVDMLDSVRLGETGGRLRFELPSGKTIGEPTISIYGLPFWRKTRFASDDNRFSLSQGLFTYREELAVEPEGIDEVLGLLRLEHTLATGLFNADVQYLYSRGPERMPLFAMQPGMETGMDIIPVYYGVDVAGAGLRAVPNRAGWSKLTLKLEAAYKRPYETDSLGMPAPEDYVQYAAGADRLFSGVFSDKDEVQLLVEYIGETGADDPAAQLRPFRSDLAARLMWRAGDFARTSFEVRGFVDVKSGESMGELSARRQLRFLHENLSLELSAQLFRPQRDELGLLALFPNNSHVRSRLQMAF